MLAHMALTDRRAYAHVPKKARGNDGHARGSPPGHEHPGMQLVIPCGRRHSRRTITSRTELSLLSPYRVPYLGTSLLDLTSPRVLIVIRSGKSGHIIDSSLHRMGFRECRRTQSEPAPGPLEDPLRRSGREGISKVKTVQARGTQAKPGRLSTTVAMQHTAHSSVQNIYILNKCIV